MRRLTVLLALLMCPAAHANPVPAGLTYEPATLVAPDGTPLHADVLHPPHPAPVIVVTSPYFGAQGDGTAPAIPAKYANFVTGAAERGWAIALVTLRGYGASGGCRDFAGPGEQQDAVAAVRWAAEQPWSDGRVAAWGLSTDGWAALMAIAGGAPVRAAVVMAPFVSAYRVMFQRGVRYGVYAELVQPYYDVYALPPVTVDDLSQVGSGLARLLGDPTCGLDQRASMDPDAGTDYWRARDLRARLRGTRTPVLWSQGFLDANVKPDQWRSGWAALRGPRRAWLGQFAHGVPGPAFDTEGFRFLARHVLGERPPRDPAIEVQEGSAGDWRVERRWPPRDARRRRFALLPGAFPAAPGNKAEALCLPPPGTPVTGWDPSCAPGPAGTGSWTFTPPLQAATWLAGGPRVRATLAGVPAGAQVHALLYDVDEAGDAVLVSRGARRLAGEGEVTVDLLPQDWRFAPGHRIGLLLAGADDLWHSPPPSLGSVTVRSGVLGFPVIRRPHPQPPATDPGTARSERTRFRVPVDPATRTRR